MALAIWLVAKELVFMAKAIDNNNQEISTIVSDNHQITIDEEEEAKHFRKVIGAFLYYK